MHRHDSATAVLEHDHLVAETLPSGQVAFLRPAELTATVETSATDDQRRQPGRWNGEWLTYRFRVMTTYALVAPSLEKAAEWFTSAADGELVDCDAMEFAQPTLVAIETADGEPVPDAASDDEPRFYLTDAGTRALAMAALFDSIDSIDSSVGRTAS